MYFVYILACADGSLYTGITNDLQKRLKAHKNGTASNYTRAKKALEIVYSEKHPDKGSALKREAEIKKWSREKKDVLITSTGAR
jgi:putative endonuclease